MTDFDAFFCVADGLESDSPGFLCLSKAINHTQAPCATSAHGHGATA